MRLLAVTLVTLFVVIFASAEARSVQDVKIAVSFDDDNDADNHERRLKEIENLLSQKCLDLCGDKIGNPPVEKVEAPSRCNGYRIEEPLEPYGGGCGNAKPIVEKIEVPSRCDDGDDDDDDDDDDRSEYKSYEVPEVADYANVNQSEPVVEVIEAPNYPNGNQSEQVIEIIEFPNDINANQPELVTEIIEAIKQNNADQDIAKPVVEQIVVAPVSAPAPATVNNGGATRAAPEKHNTEWYKHQFDKSRGPKGKHSGEDSDSNESGEDDSHERKHKQRKNGSGSDEDDSGERKHKPRKNGSGSDEDDSGEKKRHMVPLPSHGPPRFPPKVRYF